MSEGQLLEGKKIAERIQGDIASKVTEIKEAYGVAVKVVAVSVGENEASQVYLKSQERTSRSVGIEHAVISLPDEITNDDLMAEIRKLNIDPLVHGIIIQMPLPAHLSLGKAMNAIDPLKDVEGMHTDNLGMLVLKKLQLAPCTALAAMALIESTGVDLYGAEAVVVGASKIVGSPVSLLLTQHMATTTVCHIGTFEKGQLEAHVRRADVLVVAVGKASVIPGDWIKKGSIVIDVGINRVDGKIIGDVDYEGAKTRARFITPVPGGIGPLTVTILMNNVVTAFNLQRAHEN